METMYVIGYMEDFRERVGYSSVYIFRWRKTFCIDVYRGDYPKVLVNMITPWKLSERWNRFYGIFDNGRYRIHRHETI